VLTGSNPVAPTFLRNWPKGFSVDLQHFSLGKPSSSCLYLEKGVFAPLPQRAIRTTLCRFKRGGWFVHSPVVGYNVAELGGAKTRDSTAANGT
jgi:hypothetical protein